MSPNLIGAFIPLAAPITLFEYSLHTWLQDSDR
jgi:hypothetical protein